MPIPEFNFDDEVNGLPQQLVPLRYAVLVTGLNVAQTVEMTSNTFQLADDITISLLDCYEYSGNKIRKCSPTATNRLLSAIRNLTSDKERFKQLPASWFVYSDELATAFSNWIDLTIGREQADIDALSLNWNPALAPYEREIKACSAVPLSKSASTPREQGKRRTAQKHDAWYSAYIELKKSHPKKSDVQLSSAISKKYNVNDATVRRIISSRKK